MKTLVKILFLSCSLIFLYYLSLPNLEFPVPLPDALQSFEPADTEVASRKSYFTNFNRENVVIYYAETFFLVGAGMVNFIPIRLNYPPEEAQTIIRDQTRSSYLEELVYPFRESLFINGFNPASPKDAILIENKEWQQKITVKFVSSTPWVRVTLGMVSILLILVLSKLYVVLFADIASEARRLLAFIKNG